MIFYSEYDDYLNRVLGLLKNKREQVTSQKRAVPFFAMRQNALSFFIGLFCDLTRHYCSTFAFFTLMRGRTETVVVSTHWDTILPTL